MSLASPSTTHGASPPLDVLAIGPHPDDVELFVGGTIARLVAAGHRVAILDLTRGEAATRGTPELRADEARRAAEVLGVARERLDLPDGGVRDTPEQVAALVTRLRAHRPELVLAPWTDERHPDHAAAAALIVRAVFLASAGGFMPELPRHVVREVLHYPMRVAARPSFVVDISAFSDVKRRAIACHASQLQPGPGATTLVASALATIDARDRYWGEHIGATYGEPFIIRATLAIDDPVAHFRARPGAPRLFEDAP